MKIFKKFAILMSTLLCLSLTACNFSVACSECKDGDADHLCDRCGKTISACKDLDDDHLCDVCNLSTSTCLDTNNDHACDLCGGVISTCADANRDHDCDVCNEKISNCVDQNTDGQCDICGAAVAVSPAMYEVKFYEEGILKSTVSVQAGLTVSALTATEKPFYDFIGWKKDSDLGAFYDFDRAVESNLSLHAYYQLDYVEFTNELTSEYMDGLVSVHTSFVWSDGYTYASTGSGVIYAQDANYFYLLTNNHVVYEWRVSVASGRQGTLTVRDAYDNQYYATLLCHDKEYDLAVIRIQKNSQHRYQPEVFAFASANPVTGQEIVALGSPFGQKNAVTYGKVLGMRTGAPINEKSSIDFAVIKHDAWIATGSSGGMLMDTSFRIVGINFAIQTDLNGDFMYALTVPVEKVREFLVANDQLHGV